MNGRDNNGFMTELPSNNLKENTTTVANESETLVLDPELESSILCRAALGHVPPDQVIF